MIETTIDKVVAPIYGPLRLTIPAHEALVTLGNGVNRVDSEQPALWLVTLIRPPADLRLVRLGPTEIALRRADEPEYPGEWEDASIAWWERGDWVPCPRCGGALVWYEVGYVPGYRICVPNRHHARLASDGRSARAV